jgi:hypothetical protein
MVLAHLKCMGDVQQLRKTNPAMKMILAPPLSTERKAQLRQETIDICLRAGLNEEHAEIFADAYAQDAKTAHLSFPSDIFKSSKKLLERSSR